MGEEQAICDLASANFESRYLLTRNHNKLVVLVNVIIITILCFQHRGPKEDAPSMFWHTVAGNAVTKIPSS